MCMSVLSLRGGLCFVLRFLLEFFLIYYMLSLDSQSQADVISAFNDTSRYLDDVFNMDNPFFDNMVPFFFL